MLHYNVKVRNSLMYIYVILMLVIIQVQRKNNRDLM
jgi:hypothetical protein